MDVSINNAFQISRESDIQLVEIKLSRGLLLRHFLLFCNNEAPSTLYRSNRSSEKVAEHIRIDNNNGL